MTISIDERKKRARTFRIKSDMSFFSAQIEMEKELYRGVCNRAWYAVMQIVTAATYEDLSDEPGQDRPNWSHERQSIMFRNFVKKHKVWDQHKALATEIDIMRERRNDADYIAPTERYFSRSDAAKSLEIAGKVRNVVFELIGDRWDAHGQLGLADVGLVEQQEGPL